MDVVSRIPFGRCVSTPILPVNLRYKESDFPKKSLLKSRDSYNGIRTSNELRFQIRESGSL